MFHPFFLPKIRNIRNRHAKKNRGLGFSSPQILREHFSWPGFAQINLGHQQVGGVATLNEMNANEISLSISSRVMKVLISGNFMTRIPLLCDRGMELWRMCWWLTLVWSTGPCAVFLGRKMPRGAEYLFGTSKIAIEKHRPCFDRESKVIVIGDFAGFSWTYFFTQNQSHDFHIESERQID